MRLQVLWALLSLYSTTLCTLLAQVIITCGKKRGAKLIDKKRSGAGRNSSKPSKRKGQGGKSKIAKGKTKLKSKEKTKVKQKSKKSKEKTKSKATEKEKEKGKSEAQGADEPLQLTIRIPTQYDKIVIDAAAQEAQARYNAGYVGQENVKFVPSEKESNKAVGVTAKTQTPTTKTTTTRTKTLRSTEEGRGTKDAVVRTAIV
ncbi:hypothetical protein V3C99_006212, partial [Haemonchus contortus]